ncbi:hypothetical protein IW261DRAFT_501394 [Armillaria novae-zelandiae]|uniref:Uncharacterized protein n=1 Tax=Armillaria novae-zelandiae TaxID=153914 RepID=A0AA39P055_9AGAR|nr:hypothetical protein IW261DRAFT_501394 [Armillaria novae-zelandiae]
MPATISDQTGLLIVRPLFLYNYRISREVDVPDDILELENCWNIVERTLNGRVLPGFGTYPLIFKNIVAFLRMIGMVFGGHRAPPNTFNYLLWRALDYSVRWSLLAWSKSSVRSIYHSRKLETGFFRWSGHTKSVVGHCDGYLYHAWGTDSHWRLFLSRLPPARLPPSQTSSLNEYTLAFNFPIREVSIDRRVNVVVLLEMRNNVSPRLHFYKLTDANYSRGLNHAVKVRPSHALGCVWSTSGDITLRVFGAVVGVCCFKAGHLFKSPIVFYDWQTTRTVYPHQFHESHHDAFPAMPMSFQFLSVDVAAILNKYEVDNRSGHLWCPDLYVVTLKARYEVSLSGAPIPRHQCQRLEVELPIIRDFLLQYKNGNNDYKSIVEKATFVPNVALPTGTAKQDIDFSQYMAPAYFSHPGIKKGPYYVKSPKGIAWNGEFYADPHRQPIGIKFSFYKWASKPDVVFVITRNDYHDVGDSALPFSNLRSQKCWQAKEGIMHVLNGSKLLSVHASRDRLTLQDFTEHATKVMVRSSHQRQDGEYSWHVETKPVHGVVETTATLHGNVEAVTMEEDNLIVITPEAHVREEHVFDNPQGEYAARIYQFQYQPDEQRTGPVLDDT